MLELWILTMQMIEKLFLRKSACVWTPSIHIQNSITYIQLPRKQPSLCDTLTHRSLVCEGISKIRDQ